MGWLFCVRMGFCSVVILLLLRMGIVCGVPYRDEPVRTAGEEPLAVTFSHEDEWCGENW